MTYVPIVPPSPQPPSPRTRELADRLATVLTDFEQAHPSVTRREIREATQLALRAAGGSKAVAAPLVSITLGLLIALGVGVYVAVGSAGGGALQIPWAIIAVVAGLIVAGVASILARRGP